MCLASRPHVEWGDSGLAQAVRRDLSMRRPF